MSTPAKTERLMNLVICLLVARTFVPKARIRQVVGGYGEQSTEAFERMFERDKEDLRELGIPIETGSQDPLAAEEEVGYRIRRRDFELPAVTLEPDEAAVVGLAARVWQHAALAEATGSALLKLRAAGVEVAPDALAAVEPRLAAEEPAFWPLWRAALRREPVAFGYRKSRAAGPELRHLQPWHLLSWHGRWYVIGHDTDRGSARLFRLGRVVGEVRVTGRAGSYAVPPAEDVRAAAAALTPPRDSGLARLRVRRGSGYGLRRRAVSATAEPEGWDLVEVPYADPGVLAEEVAGYAADVVVVEPPDVRERLRARLRAVAAGHGSGPGDPG